ncbi:hypothetical protein AC249_AIPGENE24464 [Exaiptasia diaphana]|nr:hypothetical protein AC249_AIPGENE24464 [Exaiptasia diaphana]
MLENWLQLRGCNSLANIVYVSKAKGVNSPCGTKVSPCKTLPIGFDKLSNGGQLYVDGTGTDMDPYTCESNGGRLLLKKGFEMKSYKNHAQISCIDGIVIQANEQNPFRITIKGIRFVKTPIVLEDATASFNDCVFTESSPALKINISKQSKYVLNVSSSVFRNNSGCIHTYTEDSIGVSINLHDVLFQENSAPYVADGKSSDGIVSIQGSRCRPCSGAKVASFWSKVTIMNNQVSPKRNRRKTDKTSNHSPPGTANFLKVHAKSINLSLWQVSSHNNSGLRFLKSNCFINVIKVGEARFDGHVVDTFGGVFYITSCKKAKSIANVSVQNSIFTRNVASSGGVMHINATQMVHLRIINTRISQSFGTSNGCAVCVGNPTNRRTHNLVEKLFVEFKKVELKACHLRKPRISKSNNNKHFPATVYLAAERILQVNISSSEILNNLNYYGPTLAIEHLPHRPKYYHSLRVFLFNTTFTGNISPVKKAAVLNIHVFRPKTLKTSEARIVNCSFNNNSGLALMAHNIPNVIVDKLHCWNTTKGIYFFIKKIPNITLRILNSVFTKNDLPFKITLHDAEVVRILIQRSILNENQIKIHHEPIMVFIGFKNRGSCKRSLKINSGELVVDQVNFTSNRLLRNSLLAIVVSKCGKLSAVIKNSLFKDNVQKNIDNRTMENKLIELRMPDDPLRNNNCTTFPIYDFSNTITFQDVIFENNTCYSSLLYIINGKTSFRRCVFKDNFSREPTISSYIFVEIGTASVEFHNSTFSHSNVKLFPRKNFVNPLINPPKIMPFVYFSGTGPFISRGSNFTLDVPERVTKILIIQNSRNFSLDENTHVTCPVGSYIDFENASRVVPREYTINNCPLHIEYVTYACTHCPVSTYSLLRGSFRGRKKTFIECFQCPFGGNCGLSNIKSKRTFWGYRTTLHPEPQLNFTRCPEKYCIYPKSGRHYTEFNYCNGNRTGTMCGSCKKGFTESMFNHHCRPARQCKDNWFWVFSGVFSLAMALYIIYQPYITGLLVRKILWFKEVKTDQTKHSQHQDHGYSKIIFFFYQIVILFLIDPEVLARQHVIFSIVSLYNFEIEILDASSGCPFPGLNAVTKELFRPLQVFAAMAAVLAVYFVHRLVFFISRKTRPYFAPYIAAIVEILLLGYERLGHTSLELLNCTPLTIDDRVQWRLFVDGNITCWVHWWQYALVAYNIIFVVPFLVVLWIGTSKLRRQQISALQFVAACFAPLPFLVYWLAKRCLKTNSSITNKYQEMRKHILEVMEGPFRSPDSQSSGALFWESILIGRRLVFLSLGFLIPSPMFRLLPMTLVTVAVLVHEVVAMPYKDKKANILSVLTLSITVVIATINLCKSALVSFGISPEGRPKLHFYRLQVLEVVLLCVLPCGIIALVIAAVFSQVVRLFIKVYKSVSSFFTANENECTFDEIHREMVNPTTKSINTPLLDDCDSQ